MGTHGEMGVSPTDFKSAVRHCRAALSARGFELKSSGGYRLTPVPVQARLGRPPWVSQGQPAPYHWQLFFAGPEAEWQRGGLSGVVYTFAQDQQRRPAIDYYPVDTPDGVAEFVADFHRFTLTAIDRATSADALIRLLLDNEIAPFGGWGKGNRRNEASLAQDVLNIATAYGVRERYVDEVRDILVRELDESPQRRERAAELAAREGILLA